MGIVPHNPSNPYYKLGVHQEDIKGQLFDPGILAEMWDSLPSSWKRLKFTKKDAPEDFLRSAIESTAGKSPIGTEWTSAGINLESLPLTFAKEIMWSIHRRVELGFQVNVNDIRILVSGFNRLFNHFEGEHYRSIVEIDAQDFHSKLSHVAAAQNLSGAWLANRSRNLLMHFQDLLVYSYHRGPWWELDVWNLHLDHRIPGREHEPARTSTINFRRISQRWLRLATQYWIGTELITSGYSWMTARTRVEGVLQFSLFLEKHELDPGPVLGRDTHEVRQVVLEFVSAVTSRRKNDGRLLSSNRQRQILISLEMFYRFASLNTESMAKVTKDHRWRELMSVHSQLYLPGELPRASRQTRQDRALDDDVLSQIAEGAELLARPAIEGGFGDLQAFHALLLQMQTGRRQHEILMLDFEPLEPLQTASKRKRKEALQPDDYVARLRYQVTKVQPKLPPTIPVTQEVVDIIRAQQKECKRIMQRMGGETTQSRYLFPRTTSNLNGDRYYPRDTYAALLVRLSKELGIKDSTGRPVAISQTHRFRHSKATSLVNAGVPFSVVQRYLGHTSPEMTMFYARLKESYVEEEFLKYQKVTADGRVLGQEPMEYFDILQLEQRMDRVLPNGWCTLPSKLSCDKGNACLTCPQFVTDARYEPELKAQKSRTKKLIELRQEDFMERFGESMSEEHVWLQERNKEVEALDRILLKITDVTDKGIRGKGA